MAKTKTKPTGRPRDGEKKEPVSLLVPQSIREKLFARADAEKRSVNFLSNQALAEFLKD